MATCSVIADDYVVISCICRDQAQHMYTHTFHTLFEVAMHIYATLQRDDGGHTASTVKALPIGLIQIALGHPCPLCVSWVA